MALLLEETDFPALLGTLVGEAQEPVLPTLSNWLVLRAWADGALATALKFKNAFNLDMIDKAIKEVQEKERELASARPVGNQNPYHDFGPFGRDKD